MRNKNRTRTGELARVLKYTGKAGTRFTQASFEAWEKEEKDYGASVSTSAIFLRVFRARLPVSRA